MTKNNEVEEYEYNEYSLISNVEYTYYYDKDIKKRNLSLCVLISDLIAQASFGSEKTLFPTFLIAAVSLSSAIYRQYYITKNKEEYKKVVEILKDVTHELTLLGYDLSSNALYESFFDYEFGLISFSDKYGNNYYLYEKNYNYYIIEDPKVLEIIEAKKLELGDLEKYIKDSPNFVDISKNIWKQISKTR